MRFTKINHYNHDHSLLWKNPQEPYQCNGCKELVLGPCYECEHKYCNFHLHEECANAHPSAFHPFLKNCSLLFHTKAPQFGQRYCDACGRDILGFVYQCTHKKPHDLHPCCAKLQHSLSSNGVTIYLSKKLPSKCSKCGSKEIFKGVKGWCYVSSCGDYCYHVACVKDIILNNWKKGYFKQHGTSCLALQSFVPGQEIGCQNVGGSSNKVGKLWKKARTVIMLIISAIFGDPTTLIVAVAQGLFSN